MKNINHKQNTINYNFGVIYFSCFFDSKNYCVDHLYDPIMYSGVYSNDKKKTILEILFHALNENFSALSPAVKSGYVGAYGERWKIL